MATRRHYRSYFWPVVLIVIGVVVLLVDLNVISADRLYRLVDLWPLILIVIGLILIARRTLQGSAVDVAAALILLIAAGAAVAYVSVGPAIPGGTHTLTASDQIGTLKAATLLVDVGAADVTVVADTALGPDLYKAVITYSGQTPTVVLNKETGELHISQEGDFGIFGSRHLSIDLHINPGAGWTFNVNGGAVNATFKVAPVKVGSIELNTGAGRIDITVGQPKGMVQIRVDGGALTVHVHRPSGTEAAAQVSGGAVNLTGDGHRRGAIGSAKWQTDGYGSAADAYNIEVNGGACTVTVDTTSPAA
jgi:uncharacterized membrane protein YhaH (DUF805 family)